jgi:hypothetical protein
MTILFSGIGANTVIANSKNFTHFLPLPTKTVIIRPL